MGVSELFNSRDMMLHLSGTVPNQYCQGARGIAKLLFGWFFFLARPPCRIPNICTVQLYCMIENVYENHKSVMNGPSLLTSTG